MRCVMLAIFALSLCGCLLPAREPIGLVIERVETEVALFYDVAMEDVRDRRRLTPVFASRQETEVVDWLAEREAGYKGPATVSVQVHNRDRIEVRIGIVEEGCCEATHVAVLSLSNGKIATVDAMTHAQFLKKSDPKK